MRINLNKTVSAQADGMIISYRESNKYQFLAYQEMSSEPVVKKYQQITKPVFNKIQQKIYAETVYGLNAYPEHEIVKMPKSVVQAIKSKHVKVQQILNKWKQEVACMKADFILAKLFPKSKIVKNIIGITGYDDKFVYRHTFKDLGLDQEKIAQKLITENLLRADFFNLSLK